MTRMSYTPGVVVKYHGPTNNRGSRVSLDLPERKLPRKWISYDYAENGIQDMARNALVNAGFEVQGYTDGKDSLTVLVQWEGGNLPELWAKVGKS